MLNQIIIWQAHASPASLGFPLSSQRRVDGYEIFHLEQFLGCLYNSTPDIHSKAFLII